MAITTLDGLIAASRQRIAWKKTAARTSVALGWYSMFELGGSPGGGTLAGTSTTAGVVPDDTTAGCPTLTSFGGNNGYIANVDFSGTVAGRIRLFDLLFKAGAYAFNANTALTGQPSYLGRVPGGNAAGTAGCTEIWVEQVTGATGNQAVNVTYTNQAGVTTQTTGAVGISAAPAVGRCWQLPFAAGDSGVAAINNVAGSVASAGTFNVLVLRPLWTGRIVAANFGDLHDYLRTGLPRIWDTSALYALIATDTGTSSGLPDMDITVVSG